LSKVALLADEVGLGKTIEAGLVVSQRWAEGKRRILIIVPANLRKQWHQELNEKFFIPSTILARSYNAEIKARNFSPFQPTETVVICSYQFARAKAGDVAGTPWDLVVIDEAHRLRNVYKPSNVIANTLKAALAERHKLLLTATPLQNSLLELFGLVSFIDERSFGDLKSFREQFAGVAQERAFDLLRERLAATSRTPTRPKKPPCARLTLLAPRPFDKRSLSMAATTTSSASATVSSSFSPNAQRPKTLGLLRWIASKGATKSR
jgi:adenine-specific DNA-methyltransferase